MEILKIFNDYFSSVGHQKAFIICTVILVFAFILNLSLAIFRSGYTLSKRVWFLLLGLSGHSFLYLLQSYHGRNIYSQVYFSLFFAFSTLCFSVRVRYKKVKESEKKLISYIDSKIKEGENHAKEKTAIYKPSIERRSYAEEDKLSDINFSHVKSILERLSYYSLKESDKKQARELEFALNECERGNDTPLMRSKVNDGLSALLKIMAKYGV